MTADAVGGVWSYALELARALAPHGVEVHLATMGPRPTAAQRAAAAHVPTLTLHESEYRLEWMDAPWDDVARAGDWLLELERTLRPDVVHLNGYAHGALPWRAPALVVAHSCVRSWWRAVHGVDAPPAWDRYREAVRVGLAGAAAVVAPTRAMADALREHYGPVPHARVVPNGRTPLAAPGEKEPLVLTAGRLWDAAKNVRAAVEASAGQAWTLAVAGDASPPAGARGGDACGTGTDATNVRWLGTLPPRELGAWMARAAVYALPARYEPFGLSALEAAQAGCALVLGDVPSLREVWGDAATYVPPDDVSALRAAIARLMADDAGRVTLARRARRRAADYSPARMADGHLAAYDAAARAGEREVAACA
ncbi:glycosyltransferase family 4 protein [Roseisolibacter agri]|uniref:Glycosyl transferase n=1 Tax=Roseisolibacter agri TaxID=2014610 RepID=A0AA37Q0K3_9BACT|nr:glycosyl transferase [Roseisolibacter agri]